ncbi:hypothetical protein ADM98_11650 [Exiguobacterium sp. BMC-KP]|uniref:DUF2513 domain-containing protein n=1 Tax=Exiguobacterium sp. BMC-KP TaxID=1684312 RepID=UPI0006AA59E7|nr:DUF2513 domain-containing protein [Exiguobacterium sp. BMC-KP]KOP29515.1 hypothetical protein ADM98_11650 [Exiguobacterium sp. BMC-KP]
MKLDHDCVRETLLSIEENELTTEYRMITLLKNPRLDQFSPDIIFHVLQTLESAGFIRGEEIKLPGGNFNFVIKEMTWQGHAFLDNIRDDAVWKEVNELSSKFESVSLNVLAETAASLLKERLGN